MKRRRTRYRGVPEGIPYKSYRELERALNLGVALGIRDDPGDNSAATKMTRLAAIARIDPAGCNRGLRNVVSAPSGAAPGYIIRLPPTGQE